MLARERQVRQRQIARIPWTHTLLTHYTTGKELNAVWTAVAASQDRWLTFLSYLIPVGETARITKPVMRLKLYQADGTEEYVVSDLMLGMQKVGKAKVTEISPLGYYARWYENTWLEQINRELRESLEIDTGYKEVILYAGETILFQVKNSGVAIPSTPHASTTFEFDIDVINDADLKRALQGDPRKSPPVSSRLVQQKQEEEAEEEFTGRDISGESTGKLGFKKSEVR